MQRRNYILGGILLILGVISLVARYAFNIEILRFGPGDFWPFLIVVIGLIFEFSYFISLRKPGLLVPGGILTTVGILHIFEVITHWSFAAYTWPVYIFAVAIGLFQLYLFGGKKRGVLIATFILALIAGISLAFMILEIFFSTIDFGLVLPFVLIGIGLIIIFGRKASKY